MRGNGAIYGEILIVFLIPLGREVLRGFSGGQGCYKEEKTTGCTKIAEFCRITGGKILIVFLIPLEGGLCAGVFEGGGCSLIPYAVRN